MTCHVLVSTLKEGGWTAGSISVIIAKYLY